jgi:hypothetical protein
VAVAGALLLITISLGLVGRAAQAAAAVAEIIVLHNMAVMAQRMAARVEVLRVVVIAAAQAIKARFIFLILAHSA